MTRTGPAHRVSAWGGRLRAYRKDVLKLNQQEFAAALNSKGAELGLKLSCEQQHVSRWECGAVQQPGPDYAVTLRELGAPTPEAMAAEQDDEFDGDCIPNHLMPDVLAVVEADRRRFLAAIAAAATVGLTAELVPWFPKGSGHVPVPGKVGMADVEFVQRVTASLRGLDQRHGGLSVVDSASGLLNWSRGLLGRCEDETTAVPMSIALADLARLIGWAYHDIGEHGFARSYLTLALSYARSVGADSLTASILYVLGRMSLAERRPREALRMFQLGQISAQDASNAGESARLHTNVAWAHAMMGNRRQMHDSLARAEHEISQVGATDMDPWNEVFFTAGEQAGLTSVIFNELALASDDPKIAQQYTIHALQRATDSLGSSADDRPIRSLAFDHTTAAACLFRLGDIGSAVASADMALALTGEVLSARVVDRLRTMSVGAQAFRKHTDVREICYQVDQLALPAPRVLMS